VAFSGSQNYFSSRSGGQVIVAPDLVADEAIVQFENVGLRYGLGPEVLQDVSFALQRGSFHFLIGESGAGKSSLLKLIYLALKPSRGSISLFGHDIATTMRPHLPALRRRVGVVFQEFKLLNHLSAYDNVALPLRVAGAKESVVKKHVSELLTWVGLKMHMQARPPTLSGGQQQRVSIARAVIARPRLLLADEPTGNVDDVMGFRLMHLFEELNRLGTTVVIATHNMQVVESLGHGRLLLDDGHLTMESALTKMDSKVESSTVNEKSVGSMAAAADSFGNFPSESKVFGNPSTPKT
jgi:cell division transport system ATP-binding protein